MFSEKTGGCRVLEIQAALTGSRLSSVSFLLDATVLTFDDWSLVSKSLPFVEGVPSDRGAVARMLRQSLTHEVLSVEYLDGAIKLVFVGGATVWVKRAELMRTEEIWMLHEEG